MVANLSNIQRIYSDIPNEWVVDGEHIYNYNMLDTLTHFEHGWRAVVIPTFDTETEKLSSVYSLVNYEVVKTIVALTQQEIDDKEEALVPSTLTASQIRLAFLESGKSGADVISAINTITDLHRREVLLTRWEYEVSFSRFDADIIFIVNAINLVLKDVFILGAGL